jgi:mRNA interferase MazF
MTKGKLVLAPFPFDDLSGYKLRPVLCLTDPIGAHRQVVIAFLTSQPVTPLLASDLVLAPSHPDFTITGLNGPGTLRLHRLYTVAAARISRVLGSLSPTLQAEVDARLRKLFVL